MPSDENTAPAHPHSHCQRMHDLIARALHGHFGWHLSKLPVQSPEDPLSPEMVRLHLKLSLKADIAAVRHALEKIGLHCCRHPEQGARGVFIYPQATDVDFFLFAELSED